LPFFASGFAPQTQGIVDAGLLPARLRRQTASMPFLGCGFASQTTESYIKKAIGFTHHIV
jgi:hypothetical protein